MLRTTRAVKRLMDIAISLIAFLFLFPISIVIAILIKIEDGGPVFYKQIRVGQEHNFTLYKFRTMVVDAEKHTGVVLQKTNDPRVTRIGNFLRSTRLDELPNFFNVILGHMSVVGPRAERPEIYRKLKGQFPLIWSRTVLVKPGITGEAQLKLKSDGSLDEDTPFVQCLPYHDYNQPEDVVRYKMYYDFAYAIKLSSFWSFLVTDIWIILRTPYVMLWNKNVV